MKDLLKSKMTPEQAAKLEGMPENVLEAIYKGVKRMNPDNIYFVASRADMDEIRKIAVETNEEMQLNVANHTLHFDGPNDQGRDTANTSYLAEPDVEISSLQKKKDRTEGLKEIEEIMTDIMVGKTMFIAFFTRGPLGCEASDPTLQITDSSYVIHSEDILYRFITPADFYKEVADKGYMFINYHSAGELDENNVSKNLDKRRIFMDVDARVSYSANNQYAGNSIGMKKINHRFDNWNQLQKKFGKALAEHMFITGVDTKDERFYFLGAYPSGCGKTGTAMCGDGYVGDDLAKIWINEKGEVRSANPEKGMFGIIDGINMKDDPETMVILKDIEAGKGQEVIFSNICVKDGKPYWSGMKEETPSTGKNFAGDWSADSETPISHKNARFAIHNDALSNYDKAAEDPNGVKVGALLYGGRDYVTMPTIVMAHDWVNSVVHGAIVRSMATATEIGASGEKRSPFANEAFFPGPLGKYIEHYLAFGANSDIAEGNVPSGFQVNYWLHKSARGPLAAGEKDGLIGEKRDTKVWLRMMSKMAKGEVETLWTPIGRIPKYDDLKALFAEVIGKEYPRETYDKQFSLYIDNLVKKVEVSISDFKNDSSDIPQALFDTLNQWKTDLLKLKEEFGDVVTPEQLALEKVIA